MPRRSRQQLAYHEWPPILRQCWESVFKVGDFLDDAGAGAHLAPTSRAAMKAAFGRYLGFLKSQPGDLVGEAPELQINAGVVAYYVHHRRQRCSDQTIAIELHHLRLALRLMYPGTNWTWLLRATKQIAAQARPKQQRHHLVTSEQLFALGLALMDEAMENADAGGVVSKRIAFDYRDGLMIAFLAAIPLRRRTFAALRIGKQLVKVGGVWALDIGAEDVKNRQPLDISISARLSGRIDVYLAKFRKRTPGASEHDGVWVSQKGRPMDDGTIYDMVRRRTRQAFGFPVNLHRFRHAAATFWSIRDPNNVRGTKDLLGHASFQTTEKHYLMAQSRIAGRQLAEIVAQTSDQNE